MPDFLMRAPGFQYLDDYLAMLLECVEAAFHRGEQGLGAVAGRIMKMHARR